MKLCSKFPRTYRIRFSEIERGAGRLTEVGANVYEKDLLKIYECLIDRWPMRPILLKIYECLIDRRDWHFIGILTISLRISETDVIGLLTFRSESWTVGLLVYWDSPWTGQVFDSSLKYKLTKLQRTCFTAVGVFWGHIRMEIPVPIPPSHLQTLI